MGKVKLNGCPRCNGAVLDYGKNTEDSPMCIVCGWRDSYVPESVLEEVAEHIGKSYIEHTYTHRNVMRGKPPLSGWEREKRRRAKLAEEQQSDQRQLNAS